LSPGFLAFISVNSGGFARQSHPFGVRPAGGGPCAASGVAIETDSSHDATTAPTWASIENYCVGRGCLVTAASWPGLNPVAIRSDLCRYFLATIQCLLVAITVTNLQ
jgi:hypothetical protein